MSGAEGDKGFTYKGELEFEGTMRLSDFQSNEYPTTMDGEQYETNGENPSIGFCGCGRCKGPFFGECFAMELEACICPPSAVRGPPTTRISPSGSWTRASTPCP